MMKTGRPQRGFTLIELLVVIAIIGILASIILASLSTAQAKGRDARRVSDIKEIQLALELYYDANGSYPVTIYSGTPLVTGGYISTMPFDPKYSTACTSDGNTGCYSYTALCTSANPTTPISYHLGATLETNNSALSSDTDAVAIPSGDIACTGTSPANGFSGLSYAAPGAACNTTAGAAYPATPNTETCYDVTP